LRNNVRGKVAIIQRGEVDFSTKAKYAVDAGAVGVLFVNTEERIEPHPAGNGSDNVQIPCILIAKSALFDPRLQARAGYGRAVPTHANPDGPSFCIVTPATKGPAGTVDFQSLIDGLPGLFEDKDFPSDSSSIYVDPRSPMPALAGKRIEWKRPDALSKGGAPALFKDGTDPGDIVQGAVGDCFFLSSAAILASSKSAHLLHKLFIKTQYFSAGMVGVRFFKDGAWVDIAIDTTIPTLNGEPVFVKMEDPSEFWMIMLEKAYAKIHGCYESLDGGHMNEALTDMTGGAPGRVAVTDLVQLAGKIGGQPDYEKALNLLQDRKQGELLQGASSDQGGTEEAVGNGIYSGHAYSINKSLKVQAGSKAETLIKLRNPWGRCEWTGKWSDEDPRWEQFPNVKAACEHTTQDDGMFWMSAPDFIRTFTSLTYVDLVPETFTKLRVEGEWTRRTGGGCVNYDTWKNNPQILMRVPQACSVNIALDQGDSRLKCKSMGKAQWDELSSKGGYENYIAFAVLKGNKKKRFMSERDLLAEAQYINSRSVSQFIENVPAGDYIIVPTTFEPGTGIKFIMRFFASAPIQLFDCDEESPEGPTCAIFDASDDQIDQAKVPLSLAKDMGLSISSYEEVAPDETPIDRNRVKKYDRDDAGVHEFTGLLSGVGEGIKQCKWKVGERIPHKWVQDVDFAFKPDNTFVEHEIVVMYRSDKSMRFGKIVRVHGDGNCTIDVTYTNTGPLQKQGVPPAYIGKLPGQHGIPQAMIDQIGAVFDSLDLDGSGALEVAWDSPELSGDMAKRLLLEMQVPQNSMEELHLAMKSLDANGDGKIDRQEFITWFATRALELA